MNNLNKLLEAASYAARQHTGQERKGERAEPYINHPLEVANLLASVGRVEDMDILIAAILHDTVEDTGTTTEELNAKFGSRVTGFVLEVTDDKTLSKTERKQKQIEHAPHLTPEAKQIKLADKISNITDITNSPPANWNTERRREYVEWGVNVVAGLRGVNEPLENYFDEVVEKAMEAIPS
jgi:GTP diphosphokinase / guanosine-3',5'-bis(diphosphate) 3'-diphosphatase